MGVIQRIGGCYTEDRWVSERVRVGVIQRIGGCQKGYGWVLVRVRDVDSERILTNSSIKILDNIKILLLTGR